MRVISRNKVLIFSLLVLGLLVVVPVYPYRTAKASTSNPGGLIIPLYFYPSSAWTTLIQQKQAFPSMPVIAIIDPGGGPGYHYDSNYAYWINRLTSVGIFVVGYIDTGYGSVSTAEVEHQMNLYNDWYSISGVFLDQMTNENGYQSYYYTLTTYAHSHHLWEVVGNPGSGVSRSFVGTVDVLMIFEEPYLPSPSRLQSITMGYSRDDFALISYAVYSPTQTTLDADNHYVRFVYYTDDVMPAPYSSYPTYFVSMVARLNEE